MILVARVDWFKLAVDFDCACADRGVSLRAAALEIGVPASGLSKLRHGGRLSADAVARLVVWLWPESVPSWIDRSA